MPLDLLCPLSPCCRYANAEALNDIVSGNSNWGCGNPGFFPRQGWDAITGLGSPDFAKLAKLAEQLP